MIPCREVLSSTAIILGSQICYMDSLVKSASLLQIALGLVGGGVVFAIGALDYYEITPLVGAAIGLLSISTAAGGLKPFGDTIGYQMLLSAVFAVVGFVWFITVSQPILPLVLVIGSVLGVIFYARRATKQGIWTPSN